jgi:formylglycine-generating enzyme required for sulfatase activity
MVMFVCVMAVVNFASADTIRGIGMDFVTIGNANNSGDTSGAGDPYGCGAVSYVYRIGKYEVTNAQWNAFTAAAGVPTGNPSEAYNTGAHWTGTQQPTNNISWYESAQFCNYLTSGNKYSGAYQFDQSGNFLGIDRVSSISTYGTTYVIPTEDEWYKAAYYKPNGSGYSLYANGTNTAPSTSQACYSYSSPWDVGIGTQEQNGTFDMMGNVWELNETLFYGSNRGLRGGSYDLIPYDVGILSASYRGASYPYSEYSSYVGFRVASVPEPATLLLVGLGGLFLRRKR